MKIKKEGSGNRIYSGEFPNWKFKFIAEYPLNVHYKRSESNCKLAIIDDIDGANYFNKKDRKIIFETIINNISQVEIIYFNSTVKDIYLFYKNTSMYCHV